MSITFKLHRRLRTAVTPSPNVIEVAAMFGLGIDEQHELEIIPQTNLTLEPHQLTFITGPSGSGKSSLLNLLDSAATTRDDVRIIRFDHLNAPADKPLVDLFNSFGNPPLEQVMRWLSLAGLNDAFVMLRTPNELSDGQRYRLRLAQTIAAVESASIKPSPTQNSKLETRNTRLPIVLADEFGATLDRRTATVIARNVRKWVTRTPVAFVAATTHDDLLEPFEPDVLIEKPLGKAVHIWRRGGDNEAC
ncbi:ATP-binding cassette domain-containing protein [Phycisphaerales bacterium AB-hyl4]|uniref:ATP-binding cassette domain-containing protein n=1 Tax=Natronomicrosphaera hydrolytica TaxID=3242702 RepID=A0ABV4U7T5_9BACT